MRAAAGKPLWLRRSFWRGFGAGFLAGFTVALLLIAAAAHQGS
jgi:hypothetical protein